ncbi:MAG: glycosyltransferase family 2 protein [Candidatus Magasanikbacteria bacterium]
MQNYPKIAIVYLLYYHNESYVDNLVSALKKITYPKDKVELVIVSNQHEKDGSFIHYINDTVMSLSGSEIPHTTIITNKENLGFAVGNNQGAEWAVKNNFDYVFFHNNDGFFATNALEPLVETLEADKQIAIAQSLLLLHPETELINSTGNSFHYLGLGFCNDYRKKIKDVVLPKIKEIDYASGAAFMISTELIRKYGAWDADFYIYHEDLDWGLRMRSLGYKIVLVRDSIFYHQYQFSRSIMKFFWMERNRYAVMLMYFKWLTLLFLLPIAICLELGLWLFSFKNGYASKRWEVYKYWLNFKNWSIWFKKRKIIQQNRKVSDREMLSHSVSEIVFQDASTDNFLVNYLANPIMKLYYYVVVKGLIWW